MTSPIEAWCADGMTAVAARSEPMYTIGRHDAGACRRQSSGSSSAGAAALTA
jgi:hypothetical protein